MSVALTVHVFFPVVIQPDRIFSTLPIPRILPLFKVKCIYSNLRPDFIKSNRPLFAVLWYQGASTQRWLIQELRRNPYSSSSRVHNKTVMRIFTYFCSPQNTWEDAYLLCDCASRQRNSNRLPYLVCWFGNYSVIVSAILAAHKQVRLIYCFFLPFFLQNRGARLTYRCALFVVRNLQYTGRDN